MLDDFDGSQLLAAAGYNAGPNRPRRWREGPVLESAIWAENVPFTETRDYVKKVLSNTTSYAAVISGQPQSLKSRLGLDRPARRCCARGQQRPSPDEGAALRCAHQWGAILFIIGECGQRLALLSQREVPNRLFSPVRDG